MTKVCEHGNEISMGSNCMFCIAAAPAESGMPPGIREEFLEDALAFIMRQSMYEADGDQARGVATALKRAWLAGFKTGQHAPAKPH